MPNSAMKISFKLLLATSAMTLAFAGCRPDAPPAPEAPPAAGITSFTVSATQVDRGDEVTISYAVENATQVELRTLAGAQVPLPDPTAASGEVKVTIEEDTVFVLTAWSEGGKDTAARSVVVKQASSPVLFTAIPPEITAGESTTLVWNAPDATSVTITANGSPVTTSDQSSGSYRVSPGADTVYALDAGNGRTADVEVTIRAAIIAFAADVKAVAPGGTVTLSWNAGGASKVTLSCDGRGELTSTTDPAQMSDGTFADTVPASVPADNGVLHYVLTAEQGALVLTRDLTVYVGADPKVVRFDVPPYARFDGSYEVKWETQLADHLEISLDGEAIYTALSQAAVEKGSLTLKSPTQDVVLKLRAWNARGGVVEQEKTVDPVGLPTITSFTASPNGIAKGGDPITLSWDAPNARHLVIRAQGEYVAAEISGMAAASGSVEVYPNKDTTYELLADNTLGDEAGPQTSDVTVTTSATAIFNPPSAPVGAPIQMTGTTVSGGGDIFGLPNVVKNAPGSAFVDITQTGELLSYWGYDNSTYSFSLPETFKTRIFGQPVSSDTFSVNVNGWMVLEQTYTSGPDSAQAFPTTQLPANVLAPYYDDLYVASGDIYLKLDGAGEDRRVIVQWDQIGHDLQRPGTLTFEVQIYASGKVVYAYKDINGITGNTPTIGVMNYDRTDAITASDTPESGDTYTFFDWAPLPSSLKAPAKTYTVRQKIGTSAAFIQIDAEYPAIKPGDFEISEANLNPAVADGQWIELHNKTARAIDLNGWEVSFSSTKVFTIGQALVLPANGYLVLAQQPGAGDGVSVDYVWGNTPSISTSNLIKVNFGTLNFASFKAPSSLPPAGDSLQQQQPEGMIYASSVTGLTCAPDATATYGSNGQLGTPGAANSPCTTLQFLGPTTANFESISSTGTQLTFSNADDGMTSIPLPTPVTIEGTSYSTLYAGTNGWISLTTSTCPSGCYRSNKTVPSTSSPKGALALFWDDLDTSPGGVYWERKVPGVQPNDAYTLVSWEHVRRWSYTGDDLNFQAKFFDDGRVEFHYGTLTGNNGSSATSWWEHSSGKGAWRISTNGSPGLASDTAFQFLVN